MVDTQQHDAPPLTRAPRRLVVPTGSERWIDPRARWKGITASTIKSLGITDTPEARAIVAYLYRDSIVCAELGVDVPWSVIPKTKERLEGCNRRAVIGAIDQLEALRYIDVLSANHGRKRSTMVKPTLRVNTINARMPHLKSLPTPPARTTKNLDATRSTLTGRLAPSHPQHATDAVVRRYKALTDATTVTVVPCIDARRLLNMPPQDAMIELNRYLAVSSWQNDCELVPSCFYLTRMFIATPSGGRPNAYGGGGRYYAPATNMDKATRRTMRINGEATVELDYSGAALTIAAAQAGRDLPAHLKGLLPAGGKAFTVYLIGSERPTRSGFNRAMGQRWTKREWDSAVELMGGLEWIHGPTYLETQLIESMVMTRILARCLDAGTWVMPIHDGIRCRESDAPAVELYMREEWDALVSIPAPIHLEPVVRA